MEKIKNFILKTTSKIIQSKYKHIAGFLIMCLCIGLFSGRFLSSFGAKSEAMDSMNGFYGDMETSSSTTGNWDGNFKGNYDYSASDDIKPSSPSEAPSVEKEEAKVESTKEEKLIYSAHINIETKDIKNALNNLYSKIKEYNGIIQDESSSNLDNVDAENYSYSYMGNASAYIYVRIPQENYDKFLTGISEETNLMSVRRIEKNVENMTDVYYDQESRLRSLRTQEERLFDFMQNATTVAEMLEVENRLTDVQYEIDSITNSLNEIDNDVKYSKIRLNITEVIKYSEKRENPKNFVERVWSYIKGSCEDFLDNLEDILEFVIYAIPNVILLIIFYIVIVKVARKIRKSRRNKKDKINIKDENK